MNKLEFDRVAGLARLLEPYRSKVPGDRNATFDISGEDRTLYDKYFQELILPEVLDDGKAFGRPNNDCDEGIGRDARAFPDEYYQLLMQCYRYLYLALSSGEVFLKNTGWIVTDKSDSDPIPDKRTDAEDK